MDNETFRQRMVSAIVRNIRLSLEHMSAEERRIVFEAVAEGYCRDCGCSLNVAARCPNMDCPTE